MKKEIPKSAVAAAIALMVVLAVGAGWYYLNKDMTPVSHPELRAGGRTRPRAKAANSSAIPSQ